MGWAELERTSGVTILADEVIGGGEGAERWELGRYRVVVGRWPCEEE